jgi:hypothetical protein
MLCDDRNFVVGVLGKKKSCGEARDASTGARSATSQTMRGLTNPTTTMFGILKRLGVPSKQLRIGQVES